ncbi:MAG: hypothetical protein GDA65_19435 [Nitrospira sp. CR1.1]|jgi:type I restriction enzyme M protein|nr:hypothetical protein [Nitrospira sp. CR1.1]
MAIVATVEINQLLDYRFDAECYRPELQEAERRVAALKPRTLESVATISDGNHVSIAGYFRSSGVRYLKGAEVADAFVDDAEPTYIPPSVYSDIKRAQVFPGDVLLSVIGSVGPVALVTEKYDRLSCSCKLAILRPYGISAALLVAYLLSPTGQALLLRRNRGSVQQGVVLPDIRSFPVPRFSNGLRIKVEELMSEAAKEKRRADVLYPEAEAELLERLGWKELQQQPHELSYVTDFKEVLNAVRADAEFFEPRHKRLSHQLQKAGALRISQFCEKPSRGVQPLLVENGEIAVVDSKAVRPLGVQPAPSERTTRAFYAEPTNAKGRVRSGDVLLNSTGRGTLGRAAPYQSTLPALCDNHLTILRSDPDLCHYKYLALFLNSPAGLAQSLQFQTGSSGQLEIYPEHIQQFQVFLPRQGNGRVDLAWQQRLAAMVTDARELKNSARTKLDEAKRLVERAIMA